jgi:hypothetical protein
VNIPNAPVLSRSFLEEVLSKSLSRTCFKRTVLSRSFKEEVLSISLSRKCFKRTCTLQIFQRRGLIDKPLPSRVPNGEDVSIRLPEDQTVHLHLWNLVFGGSRTERGARLCRAGLMRSAHHARGIPPCLRAAFFTMGDKTKTA